MKKIIKFIIILFSFMYFYPNTTLGFLSDSNSFDLYKSVDEWYVDLQNRFLTREITWWAENLSLKETLNNIADSNNITACFPASLTVEDIKNVSSWKDSSSFYSKIFKSCWKNWKIGQETMNNYVNIAKTAYNQWLIKANSKVDNIYKISRIWLYSDWIKENSPFDLMIDLEEINDIVFEKELTYNWEEYTDLSDRVDNLLYWDTDTSSQTSTIENDNEITTNDWNNAVCKIDNSDLSEESKKLLLWDTTSQTLDENSDNYNSLEQETYYSPVTDDDIWPCNNFFCITVEFVTHNQNLLWNSKNNSIEWLLIKSNEHLKKFASTSLIQSKMTTNNFELWLKDLNLPDMFHVWFQITTKPVPILNLNSNSSDSDLPWWDFTSTNLIQRYYKNLWLEYKRSNDLEIFKKSDYEKLNVLNSWNSNIEWLSQLQNQIKQYQQTASLWNDYLSNVVIDQNLNASALDQFYLQFVEIDNFVKSINDYVNNLGIIIKWMDKIKQSAN